MRDFYSVCILQGIVQVGDCGLRLPNRYSVISTDLFKVPLQDYSGHCARRPSELVLGKLFGCVQLRIEEVSLGQLTNIKERASEAFSYRLHEAQLLGKARDCCIGPHHLGTPQRDVESLKVVLDSIILECDVLA